MLLPRKIFPTLKENLQNQKILILTGSRQVGKSSLMKMLQQSFGENEESLYLELESSSFVNKI